MNHHAMSGSAKVTVIAAFLANPCLGTRQCVDTDMGASDSAGLTCSDYDPYIGVACGANDDSDFSAVQMCCACGGGIFTTGGGWAAGPRSQNAGATGTSMAEFHGAISHARSGGSP